MNSSTSSATNSRAPSPSASTPISPSPRDPSAPTKPKRSNPLIDLIDSEKEYVELLAGIIRKVASAWSRTNFPPIELDTMFRSIETVYRANRGLLSKLKEIGPNPSSPKALGDLLMSWVEDLDKPYTRFTSTYTLGFDEWDTVQSNPNLLPLLGQLSTSNPPPDSSSTWTLDMLFALPKLRLKYYKKLYARLLKSTQPGRSDHRLLIGANEKLDSLMEILNQRADVRVGVPTNGVDPIDAPPPPPKSVSLSDPMQDRPLPQPSKPLPNPVDALPAIPPHLRERPSDIPADQDRGVRVSQASSVDSRAPGSSISSGSERFSAERFSRETGNTSISADRSPSAMSANPPNSGTVSRSRSPMPSSEPNSPSDEAAVLALVELENRLDTTRVLDIFSMKPKPCKLQMSKPNPNNPLPFTRSVRFKADAVVAFTPRSTGAEVIYRQAFLIMLTDLFLICERMGKGAISGSEEPSDGHDMWLLFPPLATRHLQVVEAAPFETDTTLSIQVMRKETLIVHVESREMKDHLVKDFRDAIDRAVSLAPPPRPGPGPISPVSNGMSSQPISPRSSHAEGSERDFRGSGPPDGTFSPPSLSPRNSENILVQQFSGMRMGPDPSMPPMGGRPGPGPGPGGPYGPPPPGMGGPGGPFGPPPGMGGPGGPGFQPPFPGQYPNQPMPQYPPSHPGFLGAPGQRPGMPPPGPGGYPGGPPGPGGHPGGPPGPGGFPPPRALQDPNNMRRPSPPVGLPGSPHPPGPPGINGPPMSPGAPGGAPQPHFLRKSPSSHSIGGSSVTSSMYQEMPPMPGTLPRGPGGPNDFARNPPLNLSVLQTVQRHTQIEADSPPPSPTESEEPSGPVTSVITATMKCKVFLQQQHAQWKSLGSARLKLYEQQPKNVKQLVVEDSKNTLIISTIVLTDGVERVGRTGVAIELSDQGARTGIVYMIQLKNETSASGLFDSLLAGSDRSAVNK